MYVCKKKHFKTLSFWLPSMKNEFEGKINTYFLQVYTNGTQPLFCFPYIAIPSPWFPSLIPLHPLWARHTSTPPPPNPHSSEFDPCVFSVVIFFIVFFCFHCILTCLPYWGLLWVPFIVPCLLAIHVSLP